MFFTNNVVTLGHATPLMENTLSTAALCALLATSAMAGDGFQISSPDIAGGQQLDNQFVLNGFGCEGGNLSPALDWNGATEGAKSFVVTAYDPDAPTGSGWWNWVAFDIPANVTSLTQGVGSEGGQMPDGTVQATTNFGAPSFGGACPPPGEVHRYEFTVHALSVETLSLDDSSSATLIGFMTGANTIATAKLTAVYRHQVPGLVGTGMHITLDHQHYKWGFAA